VDYPTPRGSRIYRQGSSRRGDAEEYRMNRQHSSHSVEDMYEEPYPRVDGPVPVVQRENSFSRIHNAFADPVRNSHAPTELRYTVTDAPTPTEVHAPYNLGQQPVIINNTGVESVIPDVGQVPHPAMGIPPPGVTQSHSYRPDAFRAQNPESYPTQLSASDVSRSPHYQSSSHRVRQKRAEQYQDYDRHGRDNYDYTRSRTNMDDYSDEEDYPPCVVVVERGRNGKKDTYYVVPGGQPAIFEDQHGNELTRVGDFSGRYRPRPQRPVIIEDEQGREIYRTGFDQDDRNGPSDGGLYSPSRGRQDGGIRSRNRAVDPSYRTSPHDRAYRDVGGDHYDNDRYGMRSRDIDRRNQSSSPNVVYIDPYKSNQSNASYRRNASRTSGRSSNRDPHRQGSYDSSSRIVHIDHRGRELETQSVSGSSSHSHRSYDHAR